MSYDETEYLAPLWKIARSGETMGEYTARVWDSELERDAHRLYKACQY